MSPKCVGQFIHDLMLPFTEVILSVSRLITTIQCHIYSIFSKKYTSTLISFHLQLLLSGDKWALAWMCRGKKGGKIWWQQIQAILDYCVIKRRNRSPKSVIDNRIQRVSYGNGHLLDATATVAVEKYKSLRMFIIGTENKKVRFAIRTASCCHVCLRVRTPFFVTA